MKEMPITATPATIPEPSSFSVLPVDADGFTIPPEEQGDWTKAYTQDTQNRPDAPFEDEEESVMGAPANKIKVDIRPESLPTQNDDDLKHAANVLKGGLLNLGNSKRASQIQSDKVLPEGNLTHVVMATGETEGIVKPAVFDTAVDVSTTLVPSSESQHIGVEDFAAIAKTQLVEEKENVAILAKSLESTAEISVSNGVFDPKEHPMEDKSDLPVSQTIFNGPSQIDIFGSREESLEHIETPGKKKPEIRDLDPYGDSQPPSQTESPTRSSRDLLNAFVVPAPSGTLGKPEENQGSQPSIDDTQQAYAIPPPPPTLGRKKKSRENLKSSVTVSAQAPAVATRSRRDLGLSETSLSEWGETILSHLVPEEDVSVKLSVSETINVLFKGGVADKLLLFGAVSLTLAPQRLARRGVCKVVVQNPGNFSVIVPNPEVAQASDPFSPHILDIDVSQFPPSKTSLVVPIFEYQVNCSTESKQAFVPLWVTSTWKKEPTALLLLLAYQGNNRNGSSQILLSDVMFQAFPTLPKGVTLDSVSTKPDGQWDSSNRCVSWAVPPLDPYVTAQTAQDLAMKTPMTATSPGTTNALVKAQDPTMKLLAKLDGTEAEAGYVSVSFQSSDLLSAMELSVEGMELTGTTRSLRSGKYVCLP